MPAYANHGGDSGVLSYDFDPAGTWIVVTFASGATRNYEYTAASCGAANVARLIALAQAGQGLNAYINGQVRFGYSRKW